MAKTTPIYTSNWGVFVPSVDRLLKNCARSTRLGRLPDLATPRPNRKDDCTSGI